VWGGAECVICFIQNSCEHCVITTWGTWFYHISNSAPIAPSKVHVLNNVVPQLVQKLLSYELGHTWLLAVWGGAECMICFIQNSCDYCILTTWGTWSYHISNSAPIPPSKVHVFNNVIPQLVQTLSSYELGHAWFLLFWGECRMHDLWFSKLQLLLCYHYIRYTILSYITLCANSSSKRTCV
jgi:hypothetical protein